MKYLVKFDTGPEGDTFSLLVTASNREEAKEKAVKHMSNTTHWGVIAVYKVDRELVDK